ncbi:hypothetical protein JOB18_033930 [Solea senegalensis]|uniref:Uncharacterized protein n=1 Tax=Solea senegalensis TaxID=28829 RepID=A0AAV6QYX2_SOLSE|nr:hypothetical protein JOB18_033930 [Solea senegalensis]
MAASPSGRANDEDYLLTECSISDPELQPDWLNLDISRLLRKDQRVRDIVEFLLDRAAFTLESASHSFHIPPHFHVQVCMAFRCLSCLLLMGKTTARKQTPGRDVSTAYTRASASVAARDVHRGRDTLVRIKKNVFFETFETTS